MLNLNRLIDAAASLASDTGENSEYDRALVELVSQFLPGDSEHVRAYVIPLVVNEGSPLL